MRVREVFGFATNFSIMCITFFKLYTVPGYFFREGHTCAGFVYTYTNIPILIFMLEKRNVFPPVNAPTQALVSKGHENSQRGRYHHSNQLPAIPSPKGKKGQTKRLRRVSLWLIGTYNI